jgi:hypothetical protein
LWKCVTVKYAQCYLRKSPDAKRTHRQEKHFLPVSSGFHFYTGAFRSLLRVFYALPTVQDTSNKNAQLSSATTSFRDVTQTRAAVTDVTLSRMTCAGSHLLPRIRHSLPTEEVERVKYCGFRHTLRFLPDQGGDVCKVWFRLV